MVYLPVVRAIYCGYSLNTHVPRKDCPTKVPTVNSQLAIIVRHCYISLVQEVKAITYPIDALENGLPSDFIVLLGPSFLGIYSALDDSILVFGAVTWDFAVQSPEESNCRLRLVLLGVPPG